MVISYKNILYVERKNHEDKNFFLILVIASIFIMPLNGLAKGTLIYPGTQFNVGQRYWSPNKLFFLVLQGDGNLVLYYQAGIPIWATDTNIGIPTAGAFNKNGDLIVSLNATELYNTRTSRRNGNRLSVDDNGYLRIYSANSSGQLNPVWKSNDTVDLGSFSIIW